jgi:hypothetical protein
MVGFGGSGRVEWLRERGIKDLVLRKTMAFHIAAASDTGFIKMPDPKDDPKSSEWRPYIFARDQWHCRICGDRFLYSEMVRKHIANEHNETIPPSMYEYFHGAVWQRKKLP